MIKNKTLKKSLIVNFIFILLTIIALIVIIINGMKDITKAQDSIEKEYMHVDKLYEAQVAHFKWGSNLNAAINYGEEFTGANNPQKCSFGQFIYSDEFQKDSDNIEFLSEIEPVHNEIHSSARQILSYVENSREKAVKIYKSETEPNIEKLIGKLNEFISEKYNNIVEYEKVFSKVMQRVIFVSIVTILIIIFACLRLYYFLNKEVVNNLKSMGEQIRKLSKGELNLEFSTKYVTTDMIEIKESLEKSVNELKTYIQAIDYGMNEFAKGNFAIECPITFLGEFANIQKSIDVFRDKMSETLTELDMASAQVNLGANQVSNGAQLLAQGSVEQSSSVEELSATIAEISNQISQTAEYSKTADKLGKEAGKVVKRSQDEMKQMMKAIKDIATASENIHNIIKVIDDIAFQTNILALNAAVEAARAGNAGKGFAVVAEEVRNLAQKSAEAAKDTTELIGKSLEHVHNGEKLAISTDEAFDEVAKDAEDILDMVSKIAIACDEQSVSIEQISVAIEQISSVVQMNSATSEESAAASEQLSGQANVMKSLIDQFQLYSQDNNSTY